MSKYSQYFTLYRHYSINKTTFVEKKTFIRVQKVIIDCSVPKFPWRRQFDFWQFLCVVDCYLPQQRACLNPKPGRNRPPRRTSRGSSMSCGPCTRPWASSCIRRRNPGLAPLGQTPGPPAPSAAGWWWSVQACWSAWASPGGHSINQSINQTRLVQLINSSIHKGRSNTPHLSSLSLHILKLF